MKKWSVITVLCILIGLIFIYFSIGVSVNNKSKLICLWLNNKSNSQPKVGPQALHHLEEIRKRHGSDYKCSVVNSPHKHGYKNETAILIEENNNKLIYLIYGTGTGVGIRNFLRHRYYQHWTNTRQLHH